ncbi:hypothetical protein MPRF_03220 [Mycolicibacterium parafortuitum]|uniref:Uncharacterized protein n=1 Tax=Mycolicibacterium parafortuitum TaxID=39692 RepID=A0A7I7TXT2_MYCPF|nr:hypothetical protein [Mycolicibacterium parafortuitum]PQE01886.1 hypothetical protein CYL16_07655 [Mycobacterium sp. EPG1]BBY73423.1 hypothetical protein MPRF_03220 [Mycolicibacterium parafortuitum]
MTARSRILARSAKVLGIASIGAFGAAAFISVGAATATADVKRVAPKPNVTSRQASQNSVIRINDMGVARGISEARLGDAGVVHAQGEIRDSVKAVQGTKSRPFRGGFPSGPAMGEW